MLALGNWHLSACGGSTTARRSRHHTALFRFIADSAPPAPQRLASGWASRPRGLRGAASGIILGSSSFKEAAANGTG